MNNKLSKKLVFICFLTFFPLSFLIQGAEISDLSIIDKLISDPHRVSLEIKPLKKSFIAQCYSRFKHLGSKEKRESPGTDYTELVQRHNQEHPFFLLSECGQSLGTRVSRCPLDRSVNPGYRKAYEDRVVPILAEQLRASSKAVHLVSLGSGGMFQDFVIAAKAIKKVGGKRQSDLVLHLIDPIYSSYLRNCSTSKVDENAFLTLSSKLISKKLVGDAVLNSTAQQFLTTLNSISVPGSKVFLCMYKSAQAFRAYQRERFNADLIVAADMTEADCHKGMLYDYARLCKCNPNADNCFLMSPEDLPVSPESIPYLFSICLPSTKGAIEYTLTKGKKQLECSAKHELVNRKY